MFLNEAPRIQIDQLAHRSFKGTYRVRCEKDMKRHSYPKTVGFKEYGKKAEESLKDFLKALKLPCNSDLYTSIQLFLKNFSTIPKDQIWQVFLELTDVAKRENKLIEAQKLLQISIKIQPSAHQTWLEYSKLEEECGKIASALRILAVGLQFSPNCEQIFVKFLKIEEKIGEVSLSRRILGALHNSSIEKNWKILLEGALMEARNNNTDLARHIIHSLISHCSGFGPLYLEAAKFEEKWGKNFNLALETCEKGLNRIPRYGPLWSAALRITEKLQILSKSSYLLQKQQEIIKNAEIYLSKELLWRFFLDYSIYLDSKNLSEQSKHFIKKSLFSAPENLRWKVWIYAARAETKNQNFDKAFKILKICENDVPIKNRPLVLVELSQLYELVNQPLNAKNTMTEAWDLSGKDWKICLDKIGLEMRTNDWQAAKQIALQAISVNSSTGRLWANLIQILHATNSGLQMTAFITALQEVPKSGEVWCEGGRIRLNPYSEFFDLNKAQEYFGYAIQFTPQYGDSFIEMIKVLVLKGEIEKLKELKLSCINADPNYGILWFFCKGHVLDGPREVWKRAKRLVVDEVCKGKRGGFQGGRWNEGWIGIREVVMAYRRFSSLDINSKMKFVCGSEGVIF